MDWWGISQVFVVAASAFSVLSMFVQLAKSCEPRGESARYDEHFVPPARIAPMPAALLRGPDNDVPAEHDAETLPASRRRAA